VADAVRHSRSLLYNIAGRTAVNVATDTLARIRSRTVRTSSDVKEASGSPTMMTQVIPGVGGSDFSVLSGDDNITFAAQVGRTGEE
jgi:4-hydroxy-tetrahydrodipicolinate synthase